ncbi:MAG: transglycosylase SLT domain-containing protein [Microcella sp.]|nr:transglycosylase SLT domain-containing protein [Microcella sp.]
MERSATAMGRSTDESDGSNGALAGGARRRPRAHVAERHVRRSWSLPIFASLASLALVLTTIIDPSSSTATATAVTAPAPQHEPQELVATDDYVSSIERVTWKTSQIVTVRPVSAGAPAAGTPDPGTAQAIAASMVAARGWSTSEYNCLYALWAKESGWNVYAHNKSSGAYGIPQSLPGSKMASAGADWATNPATQITWGLGYIAARYGTPCGAWAHSQRVGWY